MIKNDRSKNLVLWVAVALIMLSVFSNFTPRNIAQERYIYSQFLDKVEKGEIAQVTIRDRNITGQTKSGQMFSTYMPLPDPLLLNELVDQG